MATAGFERGLMLRSPARFQQTARNLVDLYRRHRDVADADPGIREAVLKSWMDAEAYTLATYRTASRLGKGAKIGAEASTNKIFWSELDLLMHETALRILGPLGEQIGRAPEAVEPVRHRSEEHTSELQSLMRISYAVFCLKKKTEQYKLHTNK